MGCGEYPSGINDKKKPAKALTDLLYLSQAFSATGCTRSCHRSRAWGAKLRDVTSGTLKAGLFPGATFRTSGVSFPGI